MDRVRLVGISSVAMAMLVAGACGSAARSGNGLTTKTSSPAAKLALSSKGPTLASSAQRAGTGDLSGAADEIRP